MIGQTISHFRIIKQLGEGGMGVVYLADDLVLRRRVALKFLPGDSFADPEARARLAHEAQAGAVLLHPNICPVYEIAEVGGRTFIAMAYLEGHTLRERLDGVPVSLEVAIGIARQIGEGLAAAHAKGVVHRDIKPANVMLTTEGRAVLMDFGLAKVAGASRLTRTGATLGTVAYMAPEALRGEGVDQRSDVWALGVVLYELVAGRLPFNGEQQAALVYAILNAEPEELTRPDLPLGLKGILAKALAKDPAKRYQRTEDLVADLDEIARDQGALPAGRGRPTRRRRLGMAVGAAATVGMVLAVFLALNTGGLRDRFFDGGPRIRSIAVLPLANLSADAQQEYFTDGLTEALINDLGKIGALRIISRTSVMLYKGAKKPLKQIARELGVDAVVEGSVARSGQRVRLTAQLFRAGQERQLWADSFERDSGEVMALQRDVVWAIANRIHIPVTRQEQSRLAIARQVSPEAYREYLKGRYAWSKYTLEGFQQARASFKNAIDIDPTYAEAYAGLADAHYGESSIIVPPNVAIPMARAAAEKALSLDSTLAVAHTSVGIVRLVYDWDWTGAEREFRRSIELQPGEANAHLWLGRLLVLVGRFDEGLVEIRKALELDPLNLWVSANLGWHLYFARRYDEAAAHLENALRLEPNYYVFHVFLGLVREQRGDHAGAVSSLEKAVSLDVNNDDLAQLAYVYGRAGRRRDAERVIGQLLARAKQSFVPGSNIAMAYSGLGARDDAFRWLERALDDHSEFLIMLKVDPIFDSLRSDPRLEPILRRVGLSGRAG